MLQKNRLKFFHQNNKNVLNCSNFEISIKSGSFFKNVHQLCVMRIKKKPMNVRLKISNFNIKKFNHDFLTCRSKNFNLVFSNHSWVILLHSYYSKKLCFIIHGDFLNSSKMCCYSWKNIICSPSLLGRSKTLILLP